MNITTSKVSPLQGKNITVENEVIPSIRLYSRNGKLYMETSLNNERIRKSLDTSCPKEADRKAQQVVLDSINERIERIVPIINDLLRIYEFNRLPVGKQASDDTKRLNVVRMRRILREYGIDPEVDDIRYLARKYRGQPIPEHFVQYHKKGADGMRMAKSIFSKGWMKFYKERFGIDTSFFANWVVVGLQPAKVNKFYCDERERALIEEKCGALKKSDVDLYKAYILAYGLGLRSSEVMRAKWDDLWQTEGNSIIRIWKPKGCDDGEVDGVGFQDRPCDPAWWDELMSLKPSDNQRSTPQSWFKENDPPVQGETNWRDVICPFKAHKGKTFGALVDEGFSGYLDYFAARIETIENPPGFHIPSLPGFHVSMEVANAISAWFKESNQSGLIVPVIPNRITRKFPKFLRNECDMKCTQPFHRLRKWAGHRTMRLNDNNPFIAQQVLGHSSVEMTTKIYVGMPTVKTGKIPG